MHSIYSQPPPSSSSSLSSLPSSFYQSSWASSSVRSLSSYDSDIDDDYPAPGHLDLIYPPPLSEKYPTHSGRSSFDKPRPSSDLLASDRIFATMQNYQESKKELDQLAGRQKNWMTNSVGLAPDFVFSYLLARNEIFAMMQKNLNEKRPNELAAALKDLIANSDHFAPDFIFALVKPQLEKLRVLPCDLLDVLGDMVEKNMGNASWIRDAKTSNKLEGIILLYKKKFPNTCSESVPQGMKGVYEAFKGKRKAGLASLPKYTEEAKSEKIQSKEKAYLDKIFAFLDDFYDNSERNPSNAGLLSELIAKPLIIGAVNFIAAQYLFPAIHRRWA